MVMWCKRMGVAMWGLCSLGAPRWLYAFIWKVSLVEEYWKIVTCVFAIPFCCVRLFICC
jgi:hypothetical protein